MQIIHPVRGIMPNVGTQNSSGLQGKTMQDVFQQLYELQKLQSQFVRHPEQLPLISASPLTPHTLTPPQPKESSQIDDAQTWWQHEQQNQDAYCQNQRALIDQLLMEDDPKESQTMKTEDGTLQGDAFWSCNFETQASQVCASYS